MGLPRLRDGPRRHIAGSGDISFDRLLGIGFHHGNMLVRRRMEDDFRSVFFEDASQFRQIPDVGNYRLAFEFGVILQFLLDLEDSIFIMIEEIKLRRAKSGNLAAQLRAYRAARTRHQRSLSGEPAIDSFSVNACLISIQKVLGLHAVRVLQPRKSKQKPCAGPQESRPP